MAALREHQMTQIQKICITISKIAFIVLIQLSCVSPFPNSRSFNESIFFQKTSISLGSGNKSTVCVEEDTKCEVANLPFSAELKCDVVNELALAEGLLN